MAQQARPRIGVLGVQGDVAEHVRMLDQVGAEPVVVKRPAEDDHVAEIVAVEERRMDAELDQQGSPVAASGASISASEQRHRRHRGLPQAGS